MPQDHRPLGGAGMPRTRGRWTDKNVYPTKAHKNVYPAKADGSHRFVSTHNPIFPLTLEPSPPSQQVRPTGYSTKGDPCKAMGPIADRTIFDQLVLEHL